MRDRFHDDAVAELLVALRQLSKVHGGMAQIAERAELNPTQLYRALSPSGNPELRSLSAILRAMGLPRRMISKFSVVQCSAK